MANKPQIIVDQSGPNGNIFAVTANAILALNESGNPGQALALQSDMFNAIQKDDMTYMKALQLVDQYVDVMVK